MAVWVYDYNQKHTYNYDFKLQYKDLNSDTCNSWLKNQGIENFEVDDSALTYASPKLTTGEASTLQHIAGKLNYPSKAKEEGIQGKVSVSYTITEEGKVENVYVVKGAHPILDKEACRVIREMEFTTPATLKGDPISFCITVPVSFILS